VANKRIPDLVLVTTLTGDESIPLSQAGATKRATADLLVLNKGDVPQVLAGAASATDASGNPTPDTTAFPPANYPLGTLFYAISYPAAVADGQMTFRRVGAAGSESWAWFRGSFRASNSNGDYVRTADGTQECQVWGFSDFSMLDATWTFPAAFVAWRWINAVTRRNDGLEANAEVDSDATTTTSATFKRYVRDSTLAGHAKGTWK
jgi:hypothetical protein